MKLSKTRQVLQEMLTENTGQHFLDSGGAYGRHWEKNQDRDFETEPCTVLRFALWDDKGEWVISELTHSVYHWLAERLIYDGQKQAAFERFANNPCRKEDDWFTILEGYWSHIVAKYGVTGPEGDDQPAVVNTYNGEDLLSQGMQYWLFEWEYPAVFLMIHGGCDVRSGYTKPQFFWLDQSRSENALFDNAQAYIRCRNDQHDPTQLTLEGKPDDSRYPHAWYTDDGGTFYPENPGHEKDLGEYSASNNPKDRGTGVLYIDEDGNGFCPHCRSQLDATAV